MYWIIVLYVGITLLLTLLNVQIAPFYVWSMYTMKEDPKQHQAYDVYVMKVDGQIYNEPLWKDFKRMTYSYSIAKYDAMRDAGYKDTFETRMAQRLARFHLPTRWKHSFSNDTFSIRSYPQWLKSYMSKQYGYPVQEIMVEKYRLRFDEQAKLKVLSQKVIIHE